MMDNKAKNWGKKRIQTMSWMLQENTGCEKFMQYCEREKLTNTGKAISSGYARLYGSSNTQTPEPQRRKWPRSLSWLMMVGWQWAVSSRNSRVQADGGLISTPASTIMEAAKELSHRPGLGSLGRISLSGIFPCACKCRRTRNNQRKVANNNHRHIRVGSPTTWVA